MAAYLWGCTRATLGGRRALPNCANHDAYECQRGDSNAKCHGVTDHQLGIVCRASGVDQHCDGYYYSDTNSHRHASGRLVINSDDCRYSGRKLHSQPNADPCASHGNRHRNDDTDANSVTGGDRLDHS